MFKMEVIGRSCCYELLRECTTDLLFLARDGNGNLTPFPHPETGLPMTFSQYAELSGLTKEKTTNERSV